MNYFSNNIINLRKKNKMSQEDLAEKLEISRQAISKWESGSGFPEMEKLIQISKLFKCSIDDLINKEIIFDNLSKDKIDKQFHNFALSISIGVVLIILGASLFVLFPKNEALNIILFMLIIAISVGLFIYSGMKHDNFIKNNNINIYTEEEKKLFHDKYPITIVLGVVIIILGLIYVISLEYLPISEALTKRLYGLFLWFISISLIIFIYYGIIYSKYEDLKKEIEKENNIQSRLCGAIMLVATGIYLYTGFAFNMWGKTWYVFPIGGILCAIVNVLFPDKK